MSSDENDENHNSCEILDVLGDEFTPKDNSQSLSDTSSYLPSPIVTSRDRLLGPSQTSSGQICSQTSSVPSPAQTTREQLFGINENNSCVHDINFLCTELEHLDQDDKTKVFSVLIGQIDKADLKNMTEDNIHHLSKVFGEYCRDKIKQEADNFRYKGYHH